MAWLVYAASETPHWMQARSSEVGGAHIRVDMLLIAPLLTLLTLAAIIVWVRGFPAGEPPAT